jgi:hypothetical protein
MILKRKKRKKVQILTCGYGKGAWGGTNSYTNHLLKALLLVGVDAEIVKPNGLSNPDLVLIASPGMNGENSKSAQAANDRRFAIYDEWYGRVPFILVSHVMREKLTFKASTQYFMDKTIDTVVLIEDTEALRGSVMDTYQHKRSVVIRHPFEFSGKHSNKSKYHHNITSHSKLASSKHSGEVLTLASMLPGYSFQLYGEEKGFYWFGHIKDHPHLGAAQMMGRHDDYHSALDDAAFVIDLTWFASGKVVAGGRTQYTILEAIDKGCIPIGFPCWQWDGGYDGVWLKAPYKVKNKMQYDFESWVETISNYKYDYGVALTNLRRMKKISNLEAIGNQFKHEIERLI